MAVSTSAKKPIAENTPLKFSKWWETCFLPHEERMQWIRCCQLPHGSLSGSQSWNMFIALFLSRFPINLRNNDNNVERKTIVISNPRSCDIKPGKYVKHVQIQVRNVDHSLLQLENNMMLSFSWFATRNSYHVLKCWLHLEP